MPAPAPSPLLVVLAVLLACATGPAARAQAPTGPQVAALRRLGVPSDVVTALFKTEAEAASLLGGPSAEEWVTDEESGDEVHVLHYALAEGVSLALTVCSGPLRARTGISRSFAFCEAVVTRAFPDADAALAFTYAAEEAIRGVARRKFGERDTTYYAMGALWAHVAQGGRPGRTDIVLEPAR